MSNKQAVIGALKRVKDVVIDKTSDVLSAPARMYYKGKSDHADYKYKQIKEKQRLTAMDKAGVADEGNESDPLFRHRINALNEAFDREQARKRAR